MKKITRKGSATLTIIITAIVFLIYAASTYTDISHLKKMHNKYFNNIQDTYNKEYDYKKTLI
ncbi:MAG: hypothetical protein IKV94_04190 [Clostridia bacterium]|nr:hypothetical protein [Clostridia bacterium]